MAERIGLVLNIFDNETAEVMTEKQCACSGCQDTRIAHRAFPEATRSSLSCKTMSAPFPEMLWRLSTRQMR